MDQFTVQKTIGSGSFGVAYLVTRNGTDEREKLVVKRINMSGMGEDEQAASLNEVNVLRSFSNENSFIIGYHDSFIENKGLHIVLDYANGGDLSEYTKNKRKKNKWLSERIVIKWFIQLCSALKYVHSRRVLHRDLKTQNIFLASVPGDKDYCVKLGDFGISKVLNSTSECASTIIGTPYYLSPELCEDKPYNEKSDVWALGCVLYEMCTLKHAFNGKSMCQLVLKILKGKYPPIPHHGGGPDVYSREIGLMVQQMFSYRADRRPSVAALLQTPFLKKHIHELEKRERTNLQQYMRVKGAVRKKNNAMDGGMRTREAELQFANRQRAIKVLSPDLKQMRQDQRNFLVDLERLSVKGGNGRGTRIGHEKDRHRRRRWEERSDVPKAPSARGGRAFQAGPVVRNEIKNLAARINANKSAQRKSRNEKKSKERQAVQEYVRDMKRREKMVQSKYKRQQAQRQAQLRNHEQQLKKQLKSVKPKINIKALRQSARSSRGGKDNWNFEGCVVPPSYAKAGSDADDGEAGSDEFYDVEEEDLVGDGCQTNPGGKERILNQLQLEILKELDDYEQSQGGDPGPPDGKDNWKSVAMPWDDYSSNLDTFSESERWTHNLADAHEYSAQQVFSKKLRACNDLEDLARKPTEAEQLNLHVDVSVSAELHDQTEQSLASSSPTAPQNLSQMVEMLRLDCEKSLGIDVFVSCYNYLAERQHTRQLEYCEQEENEIENVFFSIIVPTVGEEEKFVVLGKVQLLLFYEDKLNSKNC